MQTERSIRQKLQQALEPTYLDLINESHKHSGPATESHFKVTLVSEAFAGMRAVQRHQRVYSLLAEELQSGVHALALHLYTDEEWAAQQQESPPSPNCMGGGKTRPDLG
jgi:BolA protein